MTLSLIHCEILTLVALIAGFLSAITGSSGMIILPALLLAGLPPHHALGTNKLYTSANLFTSTTYYIKQGLLKPRYWIAISVAVMLGAIMGVALTQLFSPQFLTVLLPAIIAGIALFLFFHKKPSVTEQTKVPTNQRAWRSLFLGSSLGLYSGFIGAGTGALWTSVAVGFFKIDMIEASALSRFLCFISNTIALAVFMYLQEVDYLLGLSLAVSGSIGAYIGAKAALKLGADFVRSMLIATTVFMSCNLAWQNWL